MTPATEANRQIDEERLEALLHHFVEDLGAAMSYPLVLVGERLELFKSMADGRPVTPAELAERTGTDERHIAEWLAAMAASGYVAYDSPARSYRLEPEQALVLASEDGPAYIPGAFHVAASVLRDHQLVADAITSGDGLAWSEHDEALFHGTERFFRPGYAAHLASSWIPALQGVHEKLTVGGRVADIGCGRGASTILMAEAYPRSVLVGSDNHAPSIEAARAGAERQGVASRVEFEVAGADEFSGSDYDLVCVFDALHDMGDPVRVAERVREAIHEDGTWMIVEPIAGDDVEENLNPVGRVFYAASTAICVPNAVSQDGDSALGAQAGEARMRDVLGQAGFSRVRRAAETPFNYVLEARA